MKTETNLLSIPEYSQHKGISRQAIYAQIKRNKLETTKENGITYIKVTETKKMKTYSQDEQPEENLQSIKIKHQKQKVQDRNKIIKNQKKEITSLRLRITKLEDKLDLKDDYIGKVMNSIIPLLTAPENNDFIDVKAKKSKKRKKK